MSALLKDCFSRSNVDALSKDDPTWLKEKRLEAWAAWEKNLGLSRASGSRFLKSIQESAAWDMQDGARGKTTDLAPDPVWGDLDASGTYGAGKAVAITTRAEAAAKGVKFMSLSQAARDMPDLVKEALFKGVGTADTAFASLNAALFETGAFLYIPAGVELKRPLRLAAFCGTEPGFFPRTLVKLGPGARAMLVEELRSSGTGLCFCSSVVELDLGPGAALSYVLLQDLNRSSRLSLRQSARLAKDASLYTLAVSRGGSASSLFWEASLKARAQKWICWAWGCRGRGGNGDTHPAEALRPLPGLEFPGQIHPARGFAILLRRGGGY